MTMTYMLESSASPEDIAESSLLTADCLDLLLSLLIRSRVFRRCHPKLDRALDPTEIPDDARLKFDDLRKFEVSDLRPKFSRPMFAASLKLTDAADWPTKPFASFKIFADFASFKTAAFAFMYDSRLTDLRLERVVRGVLDRTSGKVNFFDPDLLCWTLERAPFVRCLARSMLIGVCFSGSHIHTLSDPPPSRHHETATP
jgi:hypothetical protein